MCLIHIKEQSIIHKAVEFYLFIVVMNLTTSLHLVLMKKQGFDIIFRDTTLLMCYCDFDIGKFKLYRPNLYDIPSNCCLKFKSALTIILVTQIRVVLFRSMPFLQNLQCSQWNFPLQSVCRFSSKRTGFIIDDLATYSKQRSKRIIEKNNVRYKASRMD